MERQYGQVCARESGQGYTSTSITLSLSYQPPVLSLTTFIKVIIHHVINKEEAFTSAMETNTCSFNLNKGIMILNIVWWSWKYSIYFSPSCHIKRNLNYIAEFKSRTFYPPSNRKAPSSATSAFALCKIHFIHIHIKCQLHCPIQSRKFDPPTNIKAPSSATSLVSTLALCPPLDSGFWGLPGQKQLQSLQNWDRKEQYFHQIIVTKYICVLDEYRWIITWFVTLISMFVKIDLDIMQKEC